MTADRRILAPGARIGILGGGQLGRMMAVAAAELGFQCHIFSTEADAPACQVAAAATIAAYEDAEALAAFARGVDVVTYEFENVPAETARILSREAPVYPSPEALHIAQDRLLEKNFLRGIGIATAPFMDVPDLAALRAATKEIGLPAILKTRRFGYDGKGQVKITAADTIDAAYEAIAKVPAILEGLVPFEREISVVVARGLDGRIAAYDAVENIHRNHILHQTLAPAHLSADIAAEARNIAERIVERLDYVGVMGVEMFLLPDGGTHRLLVNEVAPRVHNSGHWTQDACLVSQFEQHIRAICGWDLGSPERHSDAVMTNLIGDEIRSWRDFSRDPACAVHIYGKGDARPGRKMGHINRLFALNGRP